MNITSTFLLAAISLSQGTTEIVVDKAAPKGTWSMHDRQLAILSAYEHYLFSGDAEDAKRFVRQQIVEQLMKIREMDIKALSEKK